MLSKRILNKLVHSARVAVAIVTLSFSLGGTLANATPPDKNHDKDKEKNRESASPIEHVIVIVGENRTFDHIFATYEPKRGESVDNLLSMQIIREDGTPGPNYSLAHHFTS